MSEDTGVDSAGGEVSAQEIAEAKQNGWADKDAWRGDPADWVDARAFNERSRSILPIVNARNKKLQEDIARLQGQLEPLATELRGTKATLSALEESHEADLEAAREAERKRIKTELAEASREGDHAAVADLTDELTRLNAAPAKEEKKPAVDSADRGEQIHPEVTAWFREEANQSFVNDETAMILATGLSAKLRQSGDRRSPREHLDAVRAEVEKRLGIPAGNNGVNRVSGGNGGLGRSGGGGGEKGYADLPKEAKEICERQAKRLVGEGRAHKTLQSWQSSYAKQYWALEGGR